MTLQVSIAKVLPGFTLDVSWEVGNELAVLFGFSGAGKSMTFRMIAGVMVPDRGLITLDNRVLFEQPSGTDLSPQERSLGYVFQDLALFPHMTVMENIRFGGHGKNRKLRDGEARMLVRRFHLSGLEDRFPSQISGGQQQRVALARALMRHPKALLLDEPFSALDAPVRAEMQQLVKEVQKELSIPVVLITHDLNEACGIADRMIVYSSGRVIQAGTPAEIVRHPFAAEVEQLVSYRIGLCEQKLGPC